MCFCSTVLPATKDFNINLRFNTFVLTKCHRLLVKEVSSAGIQISSNGASRRPSGDQPYEANEVLAITDGQRNRHIGRCLMLPQSDNGTSPSQAGRTAASCSKGGFGVGLAAEPAAPGRPRLTERRRRLPQPAQQARPKRADRSPTDSGSSASRASSPAGHTSRAGSPPVEVSRTRRAPGATMPSPRESNPVQKGDGAL